MTNVFLSLAELPARATYVRDDITYIVLDPAMYEGVSLSQLTPSVFLLDGTLFDRCDSLLRSFAGASFPADNSVEVVNLNKTAFIKVVRESTLLGLKYAKWIADGLWARYQDRVVVCTASKPLCWTNPQELPSYGTQLTVVIGGQYGTPTTVTIRVTGDVTTPRQLLMDLFNFCQNDEASWLSTKSYAFKVMSSSSPSCPSMSTGDIITMTHAYTQPVDSVWAPSVWQVTSNDFAQIALLRPF